MKINNFISAWLVIFVSLALLGCQQDQADPLAETAVVEATPTYIRHFGEPPPVKEGRAYAVVGYLPRQGVGEKIGALPMFLFSTEKLLENVLRKLTSGELTRDQKTSFYHPFPQDLALAIHPPDDGTLSLELVTEQSWNAKEQLAARKALVETALQFSLLELESRHRRIKNR